MKPSQTIRKKPKTALRQKLAFRSALFAISFATLFAVGYFLINTGKSTDAMAAAGKDGAKTVSTTNAVLNEYTTLSSDAAVSATTITVASSALNDSSRFGASLGNGDLVMIIQMQGISMTVTDDANYGNISNYNNCGKYEFATVSSRPSSTTITLTTGLKNAYTAAGKVQVIRVPRYSSLTVNSGASVRSQDWNGSTGGIVAIESGSTIVLNGSIDVSGRGFRGGVVKQTSSFPGVAPFYRSATATDGAEKGEGIGGYQASYTNGRYGRGAPANGGGGGNSHNCSGGGGANAAPSGSWTGLGTPDTSVSGWKTAWNLEGSSFGSTSSPGGGRGGYAYSANTKSPTSVAPGTSTWGGDSRKNYGGLGGRPLDYSSGRIFMGGGGGAGDSNDGTGTSGGDGGGIVFLLSKSNVSGTGTIYANGAFPGTTTTTTGWDGSGGGGAGGTVIIYNYTGSTTGISIEAKGGAGGNQNQTSSDPEAEGAGGGGGGGYIAITSSSGVTKTVTGGLQGSTNSATMSSFTPNGGTKGGIGVSVGTAPAAPYTSGNPLPVELIGFTAKAENGKVITAWKTASEENNDYFLVERSTNAVDFTTINKTKGSGNSKNVIDYSYIDNTPPNGLSYYRLTQVDFDGKQRTYPPVCVSMARVALSLTVNEVYPNPFTTQLNIHLTSPDQTSASIIIYSISGAKMWESTESVSSGSQILSLNPDLPVAGNYLLELKTESGAHAVYKIMKR